MADNTPAPFRPVTDFVVTHAQYLDAVIDRSVDSESVNAGINVAFKSGTTTFLETFTDHGTRLQRLQACLQPIPFDPSRTVSWSTPNDLPPFCSIADVSTTFRLNFWKHVCFEKYARHVLSSWTRDIEDVADMQIVNEERARYQLHP
jgi:hypothetical protein